jgi:intracellular septation protein
MKQLIDWGAFLLFGAAYYWHRDIYFATKVLMVSLWAALLLDWLTTKRLNRMLLAVAILANVLGAFTLTLHNPTFIKLKPTIAYGVFALVCLGSQFVGKQVLMERLMQSAVTLPQHAWRRLNLAWATFFVFCAALNLYVAFNFPEPIWVNLKMFGFTIMTFVFAIAQAPYLMRHMPNETPSNPQPPA